MNLLKSVADYYEQNLLGDDPTAINYLKEMGITSSEVIKAFNIGYATTGVSKVFENDQLKELGLVTYNNHLRHLNSLTFTLANIDGEVTDIFTLNMGKRGFCKTIHSKAKGIGHVSVLKSTDDVVITDYPLEALKLYQEGVRNVMLVPDIHAAKMFKARKVTILSYKNCMTLAPHVNAEEIWAAVRVPRDKHPIQSLKRAFNVKEPKARPRLLPQKGILDRVVSDLDQLGYVGEERNKKLAYLVAISRKLKRPLSAIIVSSSGSGKSSLMNKVSQLVPSEDKLLLSRLTPTALFYLPKDALVEKLIIVDERNGSSLADYSIRTMQTSNTLTMARPGKKQEGIRSVNVKCSYMESTTSDKINPENASRCFILHLDESQDATEAVLRAQRMAGQGGLAEADVVGWHHDLQKNLRSLPVTIPYADQIKFPSNKVVYRREQEKFLSLIEASALLHQDDREHKRGHIVASVEDYCIAYDLFVSIFSEMEQEVSRNAVSLLKVIDQFKTFTVRDVITASGWSYGMVKRTLNELLDYEYISRDHARKGSKQIFQKLDYSIYGRSVGKLTHPDDLITTYSSASQDLSIKDGADKASNERHSAEAVQ